MTRLTLLKTPKHAGAEWLKEQLDEMSIEDLEDAVVVLPKTR